MNDPIIVYLKQLETEMLRTANPAIAILQKAYLKDKFEFYGIKTPQRRNLQRPFLEKTFMPDKDQLNELIKVLWNLPQREYQLFGLDLVEKYQKQLTIDDLLWMEYMIMHKSWWDTVDFVAVHMVGFYFQKFPERIENKIAEWMNSGNIWLQRASVIFQLKYKSKVDTALLESNIHQLLGSKEFFINKAIGWMLREYSKVNSGWVIDFVNKTELSGLSRREALRLIK